MVEGAALKTKDAELENKIQNRYGFSKDEMGLLKAVASGAKTDVGEVTETLKGGGRLRNETEKKIMRIYGNAMPMDGISKKIWAADKYGFSDAEIELLVKMASELNKGRLFKEEERKTNPGNVADTWKKSIGEEKLDERAGEILDAYSKNKESIMKSGIEKKIRAVKEREDRGLEELRQKPLNEGIIRK